LKFYEKKSPQKNKKFAKFDKISEICKICKKFGQFREIWGFSGDRFKSLSVKMNLHSVHKMCKNRQNLSIFCHFLQKKHQKKAFLGSPVPSVSIYMTGKHQSDTFIKS